jgi:hypothetical protein
MAQERRLAVILAADVVGYSPTGIGNISSTVISSRSARVRIGVP